MGQWSTFNFLFSLSTIARIFYRGIDFRDGGGFFSKGAEKCRIRLIRRTVRKKMQLLFFDSIFHISAPTINLIVALLRIAIKIGNDQSGTLSKHGLLLMNHKEFVTWIGDAAIKDIDNAETFVNFPQM